MSKRMRTTARLVAVGALAVLLTGCIKLNVDFNVSSDNKVSGTMIFAFSKQLLQLTGQSAEDLIGSSVPIPSDLQGVSSKPYDDGEFVGQEFSFDSVPLTQFDSSGDPEALSIVREGDTFKVSGVLDLSSATGASGATGSIPGVDQALAGAGIRISITFPGEVTDTNGTVDGRTVTWSPKIGDRLELRATASAIGSGSSSTSTILLIGGIALGVIMVIVVIAKVMKRRTGGGPGADVAAGAGTDGSERGFGDASASGDAPPVMPPPPTPTTEAAAPTEMPPPAPPSGS